MKSGIVSLVGNTNVGKSTIFNLLSEKKISIVTHKPQTTRDCVSNLLDINGNSIFLQDIPGFILKNRNFLDKKMINTIKTSIAQSDLIVLVLNEKDLINFKNLFLKNIKVDIVVLNKIDLIKLERADFLRNEIKKIFPDSDFVEMSAIDGFNKEKLLELIVKKLPNKKKNDIFFQKKDDKFFCSEIIREKIFLLLEKEIPYSTTVFIEEMKNEKDAIYIFAKIIVFRESQKKIIIGSKGNTIKKIRINSSKELKKFFQKKIKLELFVKVDNWIRSNEILQKYSYN